MGIETNDPLRLETLCPAGVVCQAVVQRIAENHVVVSCSGSLEIGMTVRLDGPDKLILAEVIGIEHASAGDHAILHVEHFLSKPAAGRAATATA